MLAVAPGCELDVERGPRRVLHTCNLDERFLSYEDRKQTVMACPHPVRPR